MFENKIAISKNFLIAICCISLILFAVNCVNAIDLNNSDSNCGFKTIGTTVDGNYNINAIDEDKLGNSQLNTLLSQNTVRLSNSNFSEIQNYVHYNLNDGDVLELEGNFIADKKDSFILLYKNITFKSVNGATLDGRNLSSMFVVENGGSGSSFENLVFKNGNGNQGGAIFIYGKDVSIKNCEFDNNYASSGGGAIYTSYYTEQNPDYGRNLLIQNCKFYNNFATVASGAVGAYGYNTRIINCSFESNRVYNKNGGGVYGGAMQVGKDTFITNSLIKDCKFINNKAISVDGTKLAHGGASCLRDGVTYENCLFQGNSADFGGALTAHYSGNIRNCIFRDNSANDYGGAVVNVDGETSANLKISDCIFENNTAPYGGAARLSGYKVTVEDSVFNNNHASIDGGAVFIITNTLDIFDSNFTGNTAKHNGGAVYVNGESTNIQGSKFISNVAIANPNVKDDGLGGALYVNGTLDSIKNNIFKYNVARNGSAIYYDENGKDLTLTHNTMDQNQAWVYALPVYAKDIYHGESENVGAIIYGGNNIADYDNLAVSNAIYNAALNRYIKVDGQTPVSGATNSGELYQDPREYNVEILLTVKRDDGAIMYNNTLNSNYLGEVQKTLENLRPGTYTVIATHYEDNYYKGITNQTSFVVLPNVDVSIDKASDDSELNYHDLIVWTLTVSNNGPSDATEVKSRDVLPNGLVYKSYSASVGTYSNGIWDIGELSKGATATLKITTLINKTGVITNKANITAKEFDWDLTNNKDSQKITVKKATDLAITKSSNITNPKYGDLVKWTLTVVNNGPDNATNVFVNDVMPKGLAIVSSPNSYKSGKWTIGDLRVGQSTAIEIVTRVTATGSIRNDAVVNGSEYDYNPSNNHASKIINVAKATDLAVTKSVNVSTPNFGDLVKWTVVVRNNGPDGASGVNVSDVLPKGLVYDSAVASVGSYSNGVWNIGGLAKGSSATLTIVTMVNKTGSIKNSVNVTGNEYDPDKSNNDASKSINVPRAADLAVTKTVNNTSPNYHDLVKWIVTVRNNGPDGASGVNVSDVLPKGLVYDSAVASVGSYSNGVWNIGGLAKGSSATLTIVTMVNKTGSIKNSVSVAGNEYDPDKSNNDASKSINVPRAADLAVTKTINNTSPNYHDLVKWTVVVRNNGPDGASGVNVSDVLPKGLVYDSAVASVGSYSNGVWNIGGLAKGSSATLTIVTMVNKTGSIRNSVNVTGNEYDINKKNNNASESIMVPKAADLEVIKSVNNSTPNYMDLVKWTITVKNNGPDMASNVIVDEILPNGLIVKNVTGNYTNGKWYLGTLNAFSSKALEIITLVNKTGMLINNVNVSGQEYDYDETNNADNSSIDVPPSADLEIMKVVSDTNPNYKDDIKWIIVVRNNGPDKATDVKVTEVLSQAFELSSSKASKGYYIDGVWFIGNLDVDEIVNLEIITKINKTGNFTNTVNVKCKEYDYNSSNNKANKSIVVEPCADLEITKTVNNTSPNYNSLVKWIITVKNNGPDKANEIEISDVMPKGLEFVDYTATKGYYSEGYWKFCCLEVGEIQSLELISRVKAIGEIRNVATITAKEYDFNPENNKDESFIDVPLASDLQVTKLVNQSNVNYKGLVRWTLVVKNNGPSDATRVVVIDSLPEGLTFISAQGDGTYSTKGTWYVGDVGVQSTKELTIICRADKTGKFINAAFVKSDQHDYNPSNNRDERSVIVNPAADLSITKTVSKLQYVVGDLISYSVEIMNNGPDAAENITVNEVMDNSLMFKSAFAASGDYDDVNHIWSIKSLAVGEKALLNINAVATKEGSVSNKVSVISDTFDPVTNNNYVECVVEIIKNLIVPNDSFIPNVYSNLKENGFVNNGLNSMAQAGIGMKKAGIPIGLLIVISLISFAFCGSNISKKR